MRNLFRNLFIITALALSLFSNAQKITPKFLEGTWETEFHNVEFKTLNKKEIKIIITLKDSKEEVEVVRYRIYDDALYFETYYAKNDWKSTNKIVIMNNNTMVADVFSDSRDILIYERK
jgi:hypothetical protein